MNFLERRVMGLAEQAATAHPTRLVHERRALGAAWAGLPTESQERLARLMQELRRASAEATLGELVRSEDGPTPLGTRGGTQPDSSSPGGGRRPAPG